MPRIYSNDPEQNAELAAEHAAEARITGVSVDAYWAESEADDYDDYDDCDGDDEWTEEDEAEMAAFRAEYEAMKATKRDEDMAREDGLLEPRTSLAHHVDFIRMGEKDR